MNVLLDECVNRRFKTSFPSLDVVHVSDIDLDTLKNGALLREAEGRFEAMITIDRNMRFQSSLRGMRMAVIVLHARNNSLPELQRFVPEIEARLAALVAGTFTVIERPD